MSLKSLLVLWEQVIYYWMIWRKTLKELSKLMRLNFAVMEFLYSKGEKSIQEIRDRILLASGSATYVVDNLEKKGYINRKVSQRIKE